jgi:FlgD Ig-like domain
MRMTAPRSMTARLAMLLALAPMLLGVSAATAYAAGPFTRLQVLLPGESAAPGTGGGKTGSPQAQTEGVPFDVTVRACDDQWNTVTGVTDIVSLMASDASASLPASVALQSGTRTFSVTFHAGGAFTIFAHDESDPTIPDGVSSGVTSLVIQGFAFSGISQKNQNAGQPLTMTLRAVDAGGNTVSGYSGTVNLKEVTSYGDGRVSPAQVTLSGGVWSGPLTPYRADETSINRGNVNFYAWLDNAPGKNGTSDPFTVHPGSFARVQLVVPGETPLPGSVLGKVGSPASQSAGQTFSVQVYATDNWWNLVGSGDNVRITSSDPGASTPVTGAMTNGQRTFNLSFGTVGQQTLTVSDLSNPGKQGMTSPPIQVLPSGAAAFDIATIGSPQTAGVPVVVTIRAVDGSNNTIPDYAGSAILAANTGPGSISPELVTFTAGVWSGPVLFRGAGGAVSVTCADFTSPPHLGTSNSFAVQPGPMAGMQILLPGETPRGGTPTGKEGTVTAQQAGTPFSVTVRSVDQFWNRVTGVSDTVAFASTDAFMQAPTGTTLANGERIVPVTLFRTGPQRIFVRDVVQSGMRPDTSSAVTVSGGSFARLVVLAPGESIAPGSANGRSGAATDQSINYAFNVEVYATDQWFNPVTGVTHVVRITSDDPLATLPPDQAMVDGHATMPMRLARGGFNQIFANDVTQPSITGSVTQVKAISSGFHLEAVIAVDSVRAGEPFSLTVKVTNDAGSVIQEINSAVTLEVRNAGSQSPGSGTLLTSQFQLLQGQRTVSETYTFAEPIVIIAYDDAGNAPATTNVLTVKPGQPSAIQLTSSPEWVGGNKHATLSARLVDAYVNGVPNAPMVFAAISGEGDLAPIDSLTAADGVARADFLSPRTPQMTRLRASSGGLQADLDLQTAFVDPSAPGGYVTNYPNPFHPPSQPTTIAYQLADDAQVSLRIFTLSGSLVRHESFDRGAQGGTAGLNEWAWDGRNGDGRLVASGGYIALVEAQGNGETLHVMRRRIAVVR